MDEPKGQQQIGDSTQVPAAMDERASLKAANDSQQNQSRSNKPRATGRTRNPGTVVIEYAAFLVLCLYTFFSYHQWKAMEASNRLTRESNETTRQVAAATQRLMEESNKLGREGAAESRREASASLDQGERNAQENLNLARQTLLESKRSLETVQRARLGVDHINAIVLSEGVEGAADVFVRNSGPLPATDMIIERVWSTLTSGDAPPPVPTEKPKPKSRSVILSGASMVLEIPTPALNERKLAAIREGRAFLYIQGEVTYKDGFGWKRSLGFCAIYEQKRWGDCPFHNWAD